MNSHSANVHAKANSTLLLMLMSYDIKTIQRNSGGLQKH